MFKDNQIKKKEGFMKIKAVKKGDPIELSPEEKAMEAVKERVTQSADKDHMYYCESVVVDKVDTQSLGVRKDDKKFAHNAYRAQGKTVIRRYKPSSDALFPKETKNFTVSFRDKLDNTGMPDIEVTEMTLE